jgi:hypothetical protein
MQLSDLDGFLTGVVCSPGLITPSQWLPIALGGQLTDVPPEILDLIMQRYNEIVAALNSAPSMLEPIFWQAKEGHVIAIWTGAKALWTPFIWTLTDGVNFCAQIWAETGCFQSSLICSMKTVNRW